MKLKQREANRQALESAAAWVRDADFDQLFEDPGNATDEEDEILFKAQEYAVRRIMSLIRTNP
jgi:hypothetical protein